MTKKFKNAGNGSLHEDQVVALFEQLGYHAEKVGGSGLTPDVRVWKGLLSYGVECKADLKNSASYATFKAYYDFATGTLSYKSNAKCEFVQQAKSRLFKAIVEAEIKEVWCEKTERNYNVVVPKNQPNAERLKKEIVSKADGITVDGDLVYDVITSKGNHYMAIKNHIIPLIDDYLHLPKLVTQKSVPNYFYVRVRSKKINVKSQKHSLEIQVFCGGYTHKTPKVNSKVKIER